MLVNKLAFGTNYYGTWKFHQEKVFANFAIKYIIYLAKIIPKNTKVAGLGEIFVH